MNRFKEFVKSEGFIYFSFVVVVFLLLYFRSVINTWDSYIVNILMIAGFASIGFIFIYGIQAIYEKIVIDVGRSDVLFGKIMTVIIGILGIFFIFVF